LKKNPGVVKSIAPVRMRKIAPVRMRKIAPVTMRKRKAKALFA